MRSHTDIVLDRLAFWKFNQGSADRFNLFTAQENGRLRAKDDMIDTGTAYNYLRYNPELEENEWNLFYQELADHLYREYDYLLVKPDGNILGIKNRIPRLLKHHPHAYRAAAEATSRRE